MFYRRNVHGVSIDKIRSMLHRYEENISSESLLAGIKSGQIKVSTRPMPPSEGKGKEDVSPGVTTCSAEDNASKLKFVFLLRPYNNLKNI